MRSHVTRWVLLNGARVQTQVQAWQMRMRGRRTWQCAATRLFIRQGSVCHSERLPLLGPWKRPFAGHYHYAAVQIVLVAFRRCSANIAAAMLILEDRLRNCEDPRISPSPPHLLPASHLSAGPRGVRQGCRLLSWGTGNIARIIIIITTIITIITTTISVIAVVVIAMILIITNTTCIIIITVTTTCSADKIGDGDDIITMIMMGW